MAATPKKLKILPADLALERGLSWNMAQDDALWEGVSALVEAAGPIAEGLPAAAAAARAPRVLAFRHSLMVKRRNVALARWLRGALAENRADVDWKVLIRGLDRFGLRQVGMELESGEWKDSGDVLDVSSGPTSEGYLVWRRWLLARRFSHRRSALEDSLVRRLAADAMRRALAAERQERARWEEEKEEEQEDSSDEEGVEAIAAAQMEAARLVGKSLRFGVPLGMAAWKQGARFGVGTAATVEGDRKETEREDEERRRKMIEKEERKKQIQEEESRRRKVGEQVARETGKVLPPPPAESGELSSLEIARRQRAKRHVGEIVPRDDPSETTRITPMSRTSKLPQKTDETLRGVTAIAFAPLGAHLEKGDRVDRVPRHAFAFGMEDGVIGLCDSGRGVQWDTLKAHAGPVGSLAWDSTGTFLASSSPDGQVIVWLVRGPRVKTQVARLLPQTTRPVTALFFPEQGNLLAIVRRSVKKKSFRRPAVDIGVVDVINVSTGRVVLERELPSPPKCATFASDGGALYIGDDQARLFTLPINMDPRKPPLNPPVLLLDPVKEMAAPEQGQRRGFAQRMRRVLRRRVAGNAVSPWVTMSERPFDGKARGAVLMGIDTTGRFAALALPSRGAAANEEAHRAPSDAPAIRRAVQRAQEVTQGAEIATAALSARNRAGSIAPAPLLYVQPRHAARHKGLAGPHTCVAPCRHADVIALGSEMGNVVVLDPHARLLHAAVCATLEAHVRPVTVIAWAPDERVLVTGDEAGTIQVWNQSFDK